MTDADVLRIYFIVAAIVGGVLGGVAVALGDRAATVMFWTAVVLAAGAYDYMRRHDA